MTLKNSFAWLCMCGCHVRCFNVIVLGLTHASLCTDSYAYTVVIDTTALHMTQC